MSEKNGREETKGMEIKNEKLTAAILCVLVAGASMAVSGQSDTPVLKPQPNIVHILADDLGWQDVACYYRAIHGEESVYETPHMDRLATKGRRFMQAFSPAPTCAPSRAAYMAGQYTPHTGVLSVLGGRLARPYNARHAYSDPFYPCRLDIDTPIIADVLKEAGYTTAHISKWHVGGRSEGYPGPLDYGFDFSWDWRTGHYNDPELYDPSDKKTANHNGVYSPMSPNRITGFAASYDPRDPYALDPNDDDRPFDAVVDLSLRWMDKAKGGGKPFFMNFCTKFVHSPFSTRDRKRLEHYCKKMGVPFPTDPGRIANMEPGFRNPYYAAMLDTLDWQVGRILTYLETTDDPRNPGHKLIDNTYIMVSSDNGGLEKAPIARGKDRGRPERITDNTPLNGGKQKIFDGGIRIPFIIAGPGIETGSVCDTPIHLIDLFPTYMAMAEAETETALNLDGCNVLPVILGKESDVKFADGSVRDTLFWHFPGVTSSSSIIRKGGWKLRLNYAPELNGLPPIMLYKLYNEDGSVCDRGEANNLAESNPEKTNALLAELKEWLAGYDAPMPYKNAQQVGGARLPGAGRVPAVVERKSAGNRLEVLVETGAGKSKVVEARLIYTTNGSGLFLDRKSKEEWFEAPAEISGGIATATAPPGMTHGAFYLRDENGFLVTSEPLPPLAGPGSSKSSGTDLIQDGYAFRPGLLSLIDLAVSARENANKAGLNTAFLDKEIRAAKAVAEKPVKENPYALSTRKLRKAIKSLDVPEAKLPVLNQFVTEKW
jgi:arylsulfatase A-like enzyme